MAGAVPVREESPLAAALDAVGDRWTLLVVAALMERPLRFNDLQAQVAGIAPNVLSQRLRQAEQGGLVIAQPYSERPPRFVYELTEAGRGLAGVLRLMADWGARRSESAELPRHDACGSQLEAHWWCPTCERPVREGEAGDLHYA
jgi:DNA-binding HxlR family transcriptional regulator